MIRYEIQIIRDVVSWDVLKDEWNRLLEKNIASNVFSTFEWLRNWWEFCGNGKLFIVIAKYNKKIAGIAPLYIRKKNMFNILEFIAAGDSDYQDFIIDRACNRELVCQTIFNFIISIPEWDLLSLNEINESSSLYNYLNKSISALNNKAFMQLFKRGLCYYIMLKSDTEISKQFDRRLVSTLKNRSKKLMLSGKVKYISTQEIDIEDALPVFFDMHYSRWQSESIFSKDQYRSFHKKLIYLFIRKGLLHFSALKLDEIYIAFSYGFIYGGKLYSYIFVFDEKYSYYSPGNLIRMRDIEYYGNKISEHDLLRGSEDYKSRWTKEFKTNYRLLGQKHSIKGIPLYLYIRWVKRHKRKKQEVG